MLNAFLFLTILPIAHTDTLINPLQIESCLDDGNEKCSNDGWSDGVIECAAVDYEESRARRIGFASTDCGFDPIGDKHFTFRSLLIAHRPMLSSVALIPRLSHAHIIIALNIQVDGDRCFKGNISD
jgi:hypothetical protein